MPKPLDISGRRFGRLVAIRPVKCDDGKRRWLCRCRCGNEMTTMTNKLTSGHTISCGCKILDGSIRRTHGMKGTRVYSIWKEMRKRCRNKNVRQYPDYGGRGITVCGRWSDFALFYEDMGDPPSANHTIDRIDNDGNYEPNNCRWATHTQQSRNRRNNKRITFQGETLCLSEWEEKTGISQGLLSRRLLLGWSVEDTLTTPVKHRTEKAA